MAVKRSSSVATKHIHFRLDPALIEAAERKAQEKGHRNVSAYLRSLVSRDLRAVPDEDRLSALERTLGANHLELTRLLRLVSGVQRAQYMFLEAAVKAILSYLPDIGQAGEAANARGKARFERVMTIAEQATTEALDKVIAEWDRAAAAAAGKKGSR